MSDSLEKQKPPVDPRIHFAAERTLLAWIRTGLAMMGFGFVVARFGLFLREMAAAQDAVQQPRIGYSLWIGTTLVLLGVVVNVFAALRHRQTVRRLERNETLRFSPVSMGFIVALFLAVLGLFTATYLVFGLGMPVVK
jgi:putative membrane protein